MSLVLCSHSHRGRHVCSLCSSLLQTDSRRSSDSYSSRAASLHSESGCTPTAHLCRGIVYSSERSLMETAAETDWNIQACSLTREGAGVVEVEAAAVGALTVLVTSAAGDVAVVRLVATIPAGRVRDDWIRRTTVCKHHRQFNNSPPLVHLWVLPDFSGGAN